MTGNNAKDCQNARVSKLIDAMTLFDDDLMTRVFNQNIPATEMVLRMILGKDVHIKEQTIQKEYLSPISEGRNH